MKTPEGPSKSCKLSLHDRLLSILKSLKSDIAESFQQVSGKDLQHCEAWLKYKITPDSTKLIERDQAYQSELKAGKRIDMQAMG